MTATPEQLQMMLFDGALRFGEQARAFLVDKKYDKSYEVLCRLQNIIIELRCALRPEFDPKLCDRLAGIYMYVYKQVVKANGERDIAALDDAMRLMRFQRETWALLLDQLSKTKAAKAANMLDMPAPDARMEASISMQG